MERGTVECLATNIGIAIEVITPRWESGNDQMKGNFCFYKIPFPSLKIDGDK